MLFRGSPEVRPELFRAMRASLAGQAAHVAAFPSSYFSPNTHLTGEALGLIYTGLLFPELPAAARWRQMGRRILVDEIERQVLEDGVYFEQSTAYQCYTAEIYLHFLVLAARNGVAVPPHVAERVQLLLDFLLRVRRPDGSLPAIGDADGGRLLPLVKRGPDDARGLFAVAAAVFARADYAWAAGGPAPEVRWLLGADGVAAFAALTPRPPQGPTSRAFPAGGYVVFRSGWDAAAHQLIFDAGPLGCPVSGAHGHADLLSLQASAFGQPFLVDPGTGAYVPGAVRDHFRGSLAHSTLTIDGASQARPNGPFSWNERPHARLHHWALEGADESAAGAHDAYARPGRALRHRRRILFARRFWLVVDDVLGSGTRRVEQRFQFAPVSLSLEPSGWVRARSDAGACLWLRALAAVPLTVEVHEGAPVLG
ncbi:MAG TPA: alginate lyase family protein, partial [Planctomycetota bacterium]|nr:alginate lyase family protein [Planctomycetota bacterium]